MAADEESEPDTAHEIQELCSSAANSEVTEEKVCLPGAGVGNHQKRRPQPI